MKKVLVLGAGLSSNSLLRYFLQHLDRENWTLRIANANVRMLENKFGDHERIELCELDATDPQTLKTVIEGMDLAISMLPAKFHVQVANQCIELGVSLITPSYISSEMNALNDLAQKNGVTIINEMGVDPGIDHMSAMKIMDAIRQKGGVLKSFKSFCGGLIAPQSDNNQWHYKFTWNPRNVVLAGQGGAAFFKENSELKFIPYSQLFKRTERFNLGKYGFFDGYANRDSLKYRARYGLFDLETIYRGTLRRPGFCQGWDIFVELGLTDDTYVLTESKALTPRQLLNAFLPYHPTRSVEEKFKLFLRQDRLNLFPLFEEIGFFNSDVCLSTQDASPAVLLQELLMKNWSLESDDIDMLVMYHEFEYEHQGKRFKCKSSMVSMGEDSTYTAMSNTVGLPIAIMAKQILNGFQKPGVHIPVDKAIYIPVLAELEQYGITFMEEEQEINI